MHNLWVTPYEPEEMFPGGEFPNQNPRVGEGLATWVKKNRSLEETDLVLWYVNCIFAPQNIADFLIFLLQFWSFFELYFFGPNLQK